MFNRILIFVFAFSVYLFTSCPSISTGDSGEFCACSVILGLSHSPGYPVYCLIGKLLTVIFPFGNFAYRVNLLSSIAGSLVVVFLFSLISEILDGERFSALVSTLFFVFARWVWKSSVQAEVFMLNTLFLVLILYFIYMSDKKFQYLYLSFFLFGLAFGNHHTIVFLTPVFLIYFLKGFYEKQISFKDIFLFSLFFSLGLTVYLYLPIRSFKNPGLDWGNPENLKNLINVFTRKDYGTFALTVGEKMPLTFDIFIKQVKRYFIFLKDEITILGVIIGLTGWVFFYKRNKIFAISNFVLFVLSGLGFLLIANLPFDSLSDGIIERFFILPTVPFCISIGFTVEHFYKKEKITTALVSTLCLIFLFFSSFEHCNWRNYYLIYDYGKNILKTLKPGSILFMDGGDDTFYSTAYLCFAEGRRKDIELHDRGGLVFKNIYGDDFRKLTREEKENRRRKIELDIVKKGRPVFYSTFNKEILPGAQLYENGILYEVNNKSCNSWEFYCLLRGAFSKYSDYRSRALAPVYVFMFSRTLEKNEEKLKWLNYATNQWKDVIWLNSNLRFELHKIAYDFFNENKIEQAEQCYKKILEIEPYDINALLNLGVISERKNDLNEAKRIYLNVIKIQPENPNAFYNLGVVYWKEQNWEKVIENFRKTLELNPSHIEAKRYLKILESRTKSKQEYQR